MANKKPRRRGRGLMRQNTVLVIDVQQVRAQTPPDHAGGDCDDGDASARICYSCCAVFYDIEDIRSREKYLMLPTKGLPTSEP